MRTISHIVFHCTGGSQKQSLQSIQAWWRSMGWRRPGYHHLVMPDGKVHDVLPIEQVSNGVQGFNANIINIAYVGGVGPDGRVLDNRTEAQKVALLMLAKKYRNQFPAATICGHRDFSPDKNRNGKIDPSEWMKACPSFSVRAWLAENRITNPPSKILFS